MGAQETVHELAMYALSKKGAQLELDSELTKEIADLSIELPETCWGEFFAIDVEDESLDSDLTGVSLNLPVFSIRLGEHQERYPSIDESDWMERDGYVQMVVPLDAGLPIEFIKSLIDEAYDIVWSQLDDHAHFLIERASMPFDNVELLDELINRYGLQKRRGAIHQIAQQTVLLRTKSSDESDIPLGATKIGGLPDLPPETDWPVYNDEKPLTFIAQIDLSEIAKHEITVTGLPTQGTLLLFSVWGWLGGGNDGNDGEYFWNFLGDGEGQNGWTIMLISEPGQELVRCQPPNGVEPFPSAAVEAVSILSLPNTRREPSIASLDWSDDEYKNFDEMQTDYRSIQKGYWLKNMAPDSGYHSLGGYAVFQQEFPEELLEMNSTMLLQISSDRLTDMCWEDGGDLTFYANTDALQKGKLEQLWGHLPRRVTTFQSNSRSTLPNVIAGTVGTNHPMHGDNQIINE